MRLLTSTLAIRVVMGLRQFGQASLAELGRALGARPSSVQRALAILLDDGLVRATGDGRSRTYELVAGSPLLRPVEQLGDALLEPIEHARLVGRSNPAVELVGRTRNEFVVVFAKRGDWIAQSRAALAAETLAARMGLDVRLLDHADARRQGPVNGALRAALTEGEVLFGELDASVPDRSRHRRTEGAALGHLTPIIRLPSRRTLDELKRRHSVRRMRAFGSAVRSDFRPDSDVDVVVELEPGADQSLEALAALEDDLERRLGRDVDVVVENALHPAVQWAIEEDAVAI